ncbi:hypothetical protein OUZ56_004782 [Daphnia magna]|uniref:Uncharacterized protein n=1 Tax=Daphnia magna TaxID=35525 RepID=A0ABQ9YQV1_9CRUS|nr:hypothetical protein OUZ56_004782 [Daphnia magna]
MDVDFWMSRKTFRDGGLRLKEFAREMAACQIVAAVHIPGVGERLASLNVFQPMALPNGGRWEAELFFCSRVTIPTDGSSRVLLPDCTKRGFDVKLIEFLFAEFSRCCRGLDPPLPYPLMIKIEYFWIVFQLLETLHSRNEIRYALGDVLVYSLLASTHRRTTSTAVSNWLLTSDTIPRERVSHIGAETPLKSLKCVVIGPDILECRVIKKSLLPTMMALCLFPLEPLAASVIV